MTAPADPTAPAFLLLVEGERQAEALAGLALRLRERCAPTLGFVPHVEVVPISADGAVPLGAESLVGLDEALSRLADAGRSSLFVLPTVLDLSLMARQLLGSTIRTAQRMHPRVTIASDELDPCHPLLVHAFVDAAAECLQRRASATPARTGLLLIADGEGDAHARANSYRTMRLLWEQLSAARGEVAFLRHDRTPLPEQLEACARSGLEWILVPQFLWTCEHLQFAKVIADDFGKRLGLAEPWPMARPIGSHPNIEGWLEQRILERFKSHRDARARRAPSVRAIDVEPSRVCGPDGSAPIDALCGGIPDVLRYGPGVIADVRDAAALAPLIADFGIDAGPCFVKVTWHGYAPGTYTDAVALDALLSALPGRAVVLEGHTSSRNTGGADFDWETDARAHRTWIRDEDDRYLERTGLRDVMARHGATYLNVTEAAWDGACASREAVRAQLDARGVTLHNEELLDFVPRVLLEHAGAPFISFARFKGPTRACLGNLFGLIPVPLRAAWHGPNLTYMARVCCDLAKLYGHLFEPFGIVEGLNTAVRWDRAGLNRSRWGNYDLVDRPRLLTMSEGFATADVLACRLQGADPRRSAFFDVVQSELGFEPRCAEAPIDPELVRRLV